MQTNIIVNILMVLLIVLVVYKIIGLIFPNNKKGVEKKANIFIRTLNRLLKLKYLKLLELSIGFVKGFVVKIEFFEDKKKEQ